MELKLVDSKPLSNEIIDNFYKHLEQQSKDAERVEELEYNESKTIITRRKFLKYSTVGAVALGLGLSTEKTEAWNPLIIPIAILVFQKILRANEPACGLVKIHNQTNVHVQNTLQLKLLSRKNIRSQKTKYKTVGIPAFSEEVYEFINGPSAIPKRNTIVHARAKNRYGRKKSKGIYLKG